MIMAGTGHRPNKLGDEYDCRGPISRYVAGQVLRYLGIHKPKKVISGLAQGFDMILAIVCIKNHIPVMAYVPFRGQDRLWTDNGKNLYHWILKRCADIYVVDIDKWVNYDEFLKLPQTGYNPDKMTNRNEKMVDHSELLMSCHNGSAGGTQNCINYALKVGIEIINIDPRKTPSRNLSLNL